ncbi:MerR family transcriptional regulator [Cryptosporangium aurantiacum]|uniref:DNA-binding transcriptional regulator, MerR family n=1 Tax=Cryptosporangium aurantiacum TaxID=134849 RepID=A0A1M7RM43_9ACTN|nr:MerR family transcriptional regulator [Cryptosporangium aurantiacum]SHN47259.1 DNA-binding transcriptional regulator, MerR family [Cryptosporangium aurantiacum]
MKIGELSQATGVSVRALRHYEAEGLIESGRCSNGYRVFDERAPERVRQIRGLLDNGLPTRLIREVLPYLDEPSELLPEVPCDYLIEEVARQRVHLDQRISHLTRNRDALDAYLSAARTAARA